MKLLSELKTYVKNFNHILMTKSYDIPVLAILRLDQNLFHFAKAQFFYRYLITSYMDTGTRGLVSMLSLFLYLKKVSLENM